MQHVPDVDNRSGSYKVLVHLVQTLVLLCKFTLGCAKLAIVSQPAEGLFVLRLDYDVPSQRSRDSQSSWDFDGFRNEYF